jgi:hypothetical protein
LIYAPLETALVQYAQKSAWASIITEQGSGGLTKELKRLLIEKPYRKNLAETAKLLAENRHDTKKVTRSFQNIIISASKQHDILIGN